MSSQNKVPRFDSFNSLNQLETPLLEQNSNSVRNPTLSFLPSLSGLLYTFGSIRPLHIITAYGNYFRFKLRKKSVRFLSEFGLKCAPRRFALRQDHCSIQRQPRLTRLAPFSERGSELGPSYPQPPNPNQFSFPCQPHPASRTSGDW